MATKTKHHTYHVTERTENSAPVHVRAASIEDAARLFARRLYGRTVMARRVTGDAGQSGLFAAFQFASRVGAENRLGSDFHVMHGEPGKGRDGSFS